MIYIGISNRAALVPCLNKKSAIQQPYPHCARFLQEYSYEEIKKATDDFCDENKLGQGDYGPVYFGELHCTAVAIKVVDEKEMQKLFQFRQDLLVLGRIRHPHIVQLLGVCQEHGCLVYELMDNGSLEDQLGKK